MWSDNEIKEYIKAKLKKSRYEHSLGVSETASKLAKVYGANVEKARMAGLIHDCAKNMGDSEILKIINDNGIKIDKLSLKMPQILHGLAASIIAEKVMGIEEQDILNAVIYHTTGRENMSTLEKIIYLSDFIEPSRDFEGVKELRELAYKNLETALISAFDSSIKYVIYKQELLHMDTINARNYLIIKAEQARSKNGQ